MVDPVMEMKKSRKQKAESRDTEPAPDSQKKAKDAGRKAEIQHHDRVGAGPDAEINCGQL